MLQYLLRYGREMSAWDFLLLVFSYAILVFLCLPFHELAHAWVADKCGDDTARWHGRLTLNPLAHLDVIGTAMLVLVGFGYAKPVPVNSRKFLHYKRDMILVSLAGPLSNLLMAIAAAGIFKICTLFVTDDNTLGFLWLVLINVVMSINVSLAVFNLLPIPPLDGSRLWSTLLPGKWSYTLERYSRQITWIMFALLMFGALDGVLGTLGSVFSAGILRLFGLI